MTESEVQATNGRSHQLPWWESGMHLIRPGNNPDFMQRPAGILRRPRRSVDTVSLCCHKVTEGIPPTFTSTLLREELGWGRKLERLIEQLPELSKQRLVGQTELLISFSSDALGVRGSREDHSHCKVTKALQFFCPSECRRGNFAILLRVFLI